jgi:predicted peptidase
MMFLHGSGQRGNDLEKVKDHGPPKLVESDPTFPFILLSPQCPEGERWDPEKLYPLILEVMKKYRVDRSKVYLTGLSMGGFGTWDFACAHPELFAAIAPVCGGGDAWVARKLVNVPVWVFHGEDDTAVPIQRSEAMVAALEKAGGKVKFSRFENTGHNAWSKAYAGDDLYNWFLSFHLAK